MSSSCWRPENGKENIMDTKNINKHNDTNNYDKEEEKDNTDEEDEEKEEEEEDATMKRRRSTRRRSMKTTMRGKGESKLFHDDLTF